MRNEILKSQSTSPQKFWITKGEILQQTSLADTTLVKWSKQTVSVMGQREIMSHLTIDTMQLEE